MGDCVSRVPGVYPLLESLCYGFLRRKNPSFSLVESIRGVVTEKNHERG